MSKYVLYVKETRNKRRQKKYGLLPPKLAEATPWEKLCVDLLALRKSEEKELKI
jgi:hypothetical protein